VLADASYASEDNFTRAEQQKLRLLVPLHKDPSVHSNQPPRKRATTTLPATVRAGRRMRHHRGKTDYKLRGQTVEPVFGQVKTCQEMTTMSRRGFNACSSEWLLAATAHNLRKLHMNRLSCQPPTAQRERGPTRRPSPTTTDPPRTQLPKPFARQPQSCSDPVGLFLVCERRAAALWTKAGSLQPRISCGVQDVS
jgi:hypothetical protein